MGALDKWRGKPPALPKKPPAVKRGICHITCEKHPNRRYELLVKFIDGRALIGAKRKSKDTVKGTVQREKTNALSGKIEWVNGCTPDCPYCGNNHLMQCTCGCWSCGTKGKGHTCPQCGRRTTAQDRVSDSSMEATQITNRQKLLGQKSAPHPALPDLTKR